MKEATVIKLESLRFATETCTSGRIPAHEVLVYAKQFHTFLTEKKTSEKRKK